jgi:MinD-like ATPase involved in chromosome partitioning or flagellar assembly
MEQVSMNDGLEGRETLAFGLAASEVAVFVLALMSAYAMVRSGLPGAIAWTLAAVLAGGGALLSWGRLAGRPLLEWAVLLAGFTIRTRHARFGRLRQRLRGWQAASAAAASAATLRMRPGAATPERSRESGAVVIPLALRRLERRGGGGADADPPPPPGRSRVVGFFSLAGGTGRTTLAVEVGAILAARGRVAEATGRWGPRVALLDLARRNPSVGLRLGLPAPCAGDRTLIAHESGLLVGLAAASSLPHVREDSTPLAAVIDSPACAAANIIIVDFDCDLDDECSRLLLRCDQVLVTLTPTAGGVVDAYRSTAVLRRMGLRNRIGHVVNRWRPGIDLGETMADVGGVIAAEIPEDPGVVEAEHQHRLVALDGHGSAVAALNELATFVEQGASDVRSAHGVPRWGSNAG